jgi:sn-glycerol 3-phosphate transport system permease protein
MSVGDRGARARWREAGLAALFLVPSTVVFVVFFFYPFEQLVLRGLYRNNAAGTNLRYIGWKQYADVLGSDGFREGLFNSLKYVVFTVPSGLVLGTLLAVAANRRLRGIKFFQTVFASTIATSVAVAAVIFLVLLNPKVGVFDVNWLEDPDLALFGVSLSSIWQNLGLSFVIVLAGLQAIPEELLEAAILDGFGPVRRFFRVTLPLLSPVLMFLVVVLVVFALQAFAQVELLTQGGPARSTETLVFKIFQRQQPSDLGEGSVMAVGLFVVTFFVTLGQFLILERRVHYGA